MKKPIKQISGDDCKKNMLRRTVKRVSSGKGKLVSELIKEMRR
jgi:uncharacterized protein YlaI